MNYNLHYADDHLSDILKEVRRKEKYGGDSYFIPSHEKVAVVFCRLAADNYLRAGLRLHAMACLKAIGE